MRKTLIVAGIAFALMSAGAYAQDKPGSMQGMPGGQGEMPDHPHQTAKGSNKAPDRRADNMPMGQGDMPGHPHTKDAAGTNKKPDRRSSNMPMGQGDMPGHPHQEKGR